MIFPLFMAIPWPAAAELPFAREPLSVTYAADTLPEDDPAAPWAFMLTQDIPPHVHAEDGLLHLDGYEAYLANPEENNNGYLYYRQEPTLEGARRFSFEARFHLVDGRYPEVGPEDAAYAVYGVVDDGERGLAITTGPDPAAGLVLVLGAGELLTVPCATWFLPTTYRMEVDKTASGPAQHAVDIYVDGVACVSVPYEYFATGEGYPAGFYFGGRDSDSIWDFVTYQVCEAAENSPPTADAGPDQSGAVGQWVTLDGTGSSDPDGDALRYFWMQTGGPKASLDDPFSATPHVLLPEAPDGTTLTFSLVVSDQGFSSDPDTVDITVSKALPDEGTADLLTDVDEADLNPGHENQLAGLLEDALATTDCAAKLAALENFLATVEQGRGQWLDDATANAWAAVARALISDIAPCSTACRQDGGIEGSNIAVYAKVLSVENVPPADCAACGGVGLALDGDAQSVWSTSVSGADVVIDLGARQVITGLRVVSKAPQTYRLEVYDDLSGQWEEVVDRTEPSADAFEDICDVSARYVRFVHGWTEGSAGMDLAELQVFGHRSRQLRTVWLGTDPELMHPAGAGHAEGTSWVIAPSDGQDVWMSLVPEVTVGSGQRWMEFWVHAASSLPDDAPVGKVMVVREKDGMRWTVAEQLVLGQPLETPRYLDFEAEHGATYSFEVYYYGGAELTLDKIVLKDHLGYHATEELAFLVDGNGRRITIADEEHVLYGWQFNFQPGSLPEDAIVTIGLGLPWGMMAGGSPLSETVRVRTDAFVAATPGGQMQIKIPLDRALLAEMGIDHRDIQLALRWAGGEIETYDLPASPETWILRWPPYLDDLGIEERPFDFEVRVEYAFHVDPTYPPDLGEDPPPPTGFTADYQDYNLVHFACDDEAGSGTVVDSSGHFIDGVVAGEVGQGVPGLWRDSMRFEGGSVSTDLGVMPEAFAFDAWVMFDTLAPGSAEAVVSQAGNFVLVAKRQSSTNGIYLSLEVFSDDELGGGYRTVATNFYDDVSYISHDARPNFHHIVALYDGHFKGRIYVDGMVNANGIRDFDLELKREVSVGTVGQEGVLSWPRVVSQEQSPLVLGAAMDRQDLLPFGGAMEEVRFSDIGRFRVNHEAVCPPNCRPGDHGATGSYTNYHHSEHSSFYPWVAMSHKNAYSHRLPYIQDVTDHSASFYWRRQTHAAVDGLRIETGSGKVRTPFSALMQFCYGEAGEEMDTCRLVGSHRVKVGRDNYPESEYSVHLENLRPSTWYSAGAFEEDLRILSQSMTPSDIVVPLAGVGVQ